MENSEERPIRKNRLRKENIPLFLKVDRKGWYLAAAGQVEAEKDEISKMTTSLETQSRYRQIAVSGDYEIEFREKIVGMMSCDYVWEIGPYFKKGMNVETRRDLTETQLPGSYDRLIRFITGFHSVISWTHADRKKAGTDHMRKNQPDTVIRKPIKLEIIRAFEVFQIGIDIKENISGALIEDLEPVNHQFYLKLAATKAIQSLSKKWTPNFGISNSGKFRLVENREVRDGMLEVKSSLDLKKPPRSPSLDLLPIQESLSGDIQCMI
jgi:hypothetical protein